MNKKVFSSLLLFSGITFVLGMYCTPAQKHTPLSAVSISSVKVRENYLREMQGFCTIAIKGKILKTRLMATEDTGTVTALLMDELGIPLTVISSTENETLLKSYFPPMSEKMGNLFGLAITSFMRSIQINPLDNRIVSDTLHKNNPTYYYFTNTTIDSTIIQGTKSYYSLHYSENSFSFLDEVRDTICTCVWE